MKNTKKAFTLVELIVVISILAILGTIGFISLQGYSGEARDSKRLTDINGLAKKINIEVTRGTEMSSLIVQSATGTRTINEDAAANSKQGEVNFTAIKESAPDFQDTFNNSSAFNYPVAYAAGGTGSGSYNFMEIGTISEEKNKFVVVGNYYKMHNNDSDGLLGTTGTGGIANDDPFVSGLLSTDYTQN